MQGPVESPSTYRRRFCIARSTALLLIPALPPELLAQSFHAGLKLIVPFGTSEP